MLVELLPEEAQRQARAQQGAASSKRKRSARQGQQLQLQQENQQQQGDAAQPTQQLTGVAPPPAAAQPRGGTRQQQQRQQQGSAPSGRYGGTSAAAAAAEQDSGDGDGDSDGDPLAAWLACADNLPPEHWMVEDLFEMSDSDEEDSDEDEEEDGGEQYVSASDDDDDDDEEEEENDEPTAVVQQQAQDVSRSPAAGVAALAAATAPAPVFDVTLDTAAPTAAAAAQHTAAVLAAPALAQPAPGPSPGSELAPVCRRTRARVNLSGMTLEQLEALLVDTDDDDDEYGAGAGARDAEYLAFLQAIRGDLPTEGGAAAAGGAGAGGGSEGAASCDWPFGDDDDDDDFSVDLDELLADLPSDDEALSPLAPQRWQTSGRGPLTRAKRRRIDRTVPRPLESTQRLQQGVLRPLLPKTAVPAGVVVMAHPAGAANPAALQSIKWPGVPPPGLNTHQLQHLHAQFHQHSQLLVQVHALAASDPTQHAVTGRTHALLSQLCAFRDAQAATRAARLLPPWHAANDLGLRPAPHPEAPTAAPWAPRPLPSGLPASTVAQVAALELVPAFLRSVDEAAPQAAVAAAAAAATTADAATAARGSTAVDSGAGQGQLTQQQQTLEGNGAAAGQDMSAGGDCGGGDGGGSGVGGGEGGYVGRTLTLLPAVWEALLEFEELLDPALLPKPDAALRSALWLPSEDDLLALGMARFGMNLGAVVAALLPNKTEAQAFNRQKNRSGARAGDNPIKAVKRRMLAPLTHREVVALQHWLFYYGRQPNRWAVIQRHHLPHRSAAMLPKQWKDAQERCRAAGQQLVECPQPPHLLVPPPGGYLGPFVLPQQATALQPMPQQQPPQQQQRGAHATDAPADPPSAQLVQVQSQAQQPGRPTSKAKPRPRQSRAKGTKGASASAATMAPLQLGGSAGMPLSSSPAGAPAGAGPDAGLAPADFEVQGTPTAAPWTALVGVPMVPLHAPLASPAPQGGAAAAGPVPDAMLDDSPDAGAAAAGAATSMQTPGKASTGILGGLMDNLRHGAQRRRQRASPATAAAAAAATSRRPRAVPGYTQQQLAAQCAPDGDGELISPDKPPGPRHARGAAAPVAAAAATAAAGSQQQHQEASGATSFAGLDSLLEAAAQLDTPSRRRRTTRSTAAAAAAANKVGQSTQPSATGAAPAATAGATSRRQQKGKQPEQEAAAASAAKWTPSEDKVLLRTVTKVQAIDTTAVEAMWHALGGEGGRHTLADVQQRAEGLLQRWLRHGGGNKKKK